MGIYDLSWYAFRLEVTNHLIDMPFSTPLRQPARLLPFSLTPYFTPVLAASPPTEPSLTLPFPHGRQQVPLSQIVRFEGVGNYTYCYFLNESPLLVALSLKIIQGRLPADAFIRTHRKHLLNTQHIQAVLTARWTILLTTGEQFPVARRRVSLLRLKSLTSAD